MLTAEELEKVKIVLGDALPYELSMLEAAALYMESEEFLALDLNVARNAFTHNATIEAFWTHARCLIEFFNRGEDHNFQVSSGSAKDFTNAYHPAADMQKLSEKSKGLSTRINEQISHLGFCRKTGEWEKLGASEINRVKATINKETTDFVAKLKPDFRKYWDGPVPQARMLNLTDQVISTTNAIITLTLVIN